MYCMKLITGLGNPEKKYNDTRHNAGFLFLDVLREKFLYQKDIYVTEWKEEDTFNSLLSFIKSGSKIIAILQKPLTYMNNSGEAVAKIVKKYDIGDLRNNFILVHDDLDLNLGKFKIQIGKIPVGHNGVNNVVDRLGGSNFKSVRIGIESRDNKNLSGEDFVLMKFTEDEKMILDEILDEASKAILPEILL